MPKPNLPRGILTALITPVQKDEETTRDSLSRLIELQLKSGIKGFYTLGTYGEGLSLPVSMRKKIISLIADLVPSGFLLINNVSAASIEDALELAKHSIELGVRNIASLPPLYYKAGLKELKTYYANLGKLDCNLFIYNNPLKTGVDVTPSTAKQLRSEVPSLVGIKDSTGSVERLIDIVSTMIEDFYVGIASDPLILDALIYGADAHICGVCNAIPEIAVEIVKSFEAGDLKRASRLQVLMARFRGLSKEYQVEGLVLAKTALRARGIDVGPPSKPLSPLGEAELNNIKNMLDKIYLEAGLKYD
ncbi:MAG: dihydrodipicolinate synthase family protein [Sulfolobales archaeon]